MNVQKNKKRNTRLNTSQLLYWYVEIYLIYTYIQAATLWGLLSLREQLKAAKWAAAAVRRGGRLDPMHGDPHDYDACDVSARLFIYVFLAVPDCYRRL